MVDDLNKKGPELIVQQKEVNEPMPVNKEAGSFSVEQTAVDSELPREQEEQQEQSQTQATETEEIARKKIKRKKRKDIVIPTIRDPLTLEIEHLLEDGLQDVYKELTPIQKQEFKIEGEKAAYKIRQLMTGAHVKVKKIFKVILEWLKILPGVNRFFLEQEAKIKVDKLMSMKDKYRK